ncbi:MAG: hypothetical protein ACM33U_08980 [Solirubrobacterales bacterium]|nr:hypothetical protein [Solirubrobacterales bacterium]
MSESPQALPEGGLLMDCRQIREELGISEGTADRCIRWIGENRARVVRPAGGRKLYVYREDVQAWLDASTENAA